MNDAKKYFGTPFVTKIYEIFEKAEQYNQFVFIHGTSTISSAINILENGLSSYFPELLYTAELMNKNDKLLFEKLKSWPHWDSKYLLMICVSKNSGKGGKPIWTEDSDGLFHLSQKLIKGLIDVNQTLILFNPNYSPTGVDIKATIEDRSFEPQTGNHLKTSIPPDELAFYTNNFQDNEPTL